MSAITLDTAKCKKCGNCISLMKNYCISEKDGYPVFDYSLCNICQKCVSICPSGAIMVNDTYADRISPDLKKCLPGEIIALFEKRRSIKHFKDKPVPKSVIKEILSVAKYAPNQNKNISILVIDDRKLINEIDSYALRQVNKIHKLLFSFKPIIGFVKLFSKNMDIIKRKMEYDLFEKKHIVKENTQVIIILTGNKKVPVTDHSAQYILATMIYMAESLEVGNCLMDSLLYALNTSKGFRQKLSIKDNVLGVLSLGYSNENVMNIPRGYEVDVSWNPEAKV